MGTTKTFSGYTNCECRDCFEIVCGTGMCFDCEDACCEPDSECCADGAYGCDEALWDCEVLDAANEAENKK